MLLDPQEKMNATQKVNRLPEDFQTVAFGCTVMLIGNGKHGLFTASGVIARVSGEGDAKIVEIYTAKHNLYIFAGLLDPPLDQKPSDLESEFAQSITISFDPAVEPGQDGRPRQHGAPISRVVLPGGADDWDYDFMRLDSQASELATYAYDGNGVYSFVAFNDTDRTDKTTQEFVLSKTGFSGKNMLLQIGFGLTNLADPKSGGTLQVRVPTFACDRILTVWDLECQRSNKPRFDSVIVMSKESPTDDTAPGDSGGPLWVLDLVTGAPCRFFLIGLTLGSGFSPAPPVAKPKSKPQPSFNTCATLIPEACP